MGLENTHLPWIRRANLVESVLPLIFGCKVSFGYVAQELPSATLSFPGKNLHAVGQVEFQTSQAGLEIEGWGKKLIVEVPTSGAWHRIGSRSPKPIRPTFAHLFK